MCNLVIPVSIIRVVIFQYLSGLHDQSEEIKIRLSWIAWKCAGGDWELARLEMC